MVRTEISLFLRNAPGELGRLATLLSKAGVNIDALTIQDASEYVQELFKGRGKSLKRIAPAASYGSMRKDSADHALIRLLVDSTDKAVDLLSRAGYVFDIMPVIALVIENRPGTLAEMAKKFGEEGCPAQREKIAVCILSRRRRARGGDLQRRALRPGTSLPASLFL
jgi:hypothetical protein